MDDNTVIFEVLGVCISIQAASRQQKADIVERLKGVLPIEFKFLKDKKKIRHTLTIKSTKKGKFELLKGDEKVVRDSEEETLLDRLDSQVRITLAEFAVGYVFVHSGVVAWENKAIMIPASSFKGKTTLVSELVKQGAKYYSDEYAILDKDGLVHPFAKPLSMREKNGGGEQTDRPVEDFGGQSGVCPLPVGMVLVTEFKSRSRWKPEVLSSGQGVLEIISHTVPIRNSPEKSLNILNKVVENAVVVKSNRSEADRFAKRLIEYFEKNVLKA